MPPPNPLRHKVIAIYKGNYPLYPRRPSLTPPISLLPDPFPRHQPSRARPLTTTTTRASLPRPRVPPRLLLLPLAPAQGLHGEQRGAGRGGDPAGHRAGRVCEEG